MINLESSIENTWDEEKPDPHTLSYDSGSGGADRCLFVGVITEAEAVVGVSYNSVAMVEEFSVTSSESFRPETLQLFSLVNPPTGTNTISVAQTSTNHDQTIFAVCYNGVDQTTPVGATASRSSTESTTGEKTTTLVTTAANSRILTTAWLSGGTSETEIGPITGFAEITGDSENPGADSHNNRAFVSGMYDRAAATAASYTVGQNYQATYDSRYTTDAHIELLAAGGATVATPINPSITSLLATSARLNWEQG